LADNTANEWMITGVQLEVGEQATPFEHRSFGDELHRCQRYYFHTYGQGNTVGASFDASYAGMVYFIGTGNFGMAPLNTTFPTEMRSSPTITFYGHNGTANRITYWNSGSESTYGTVNRNTRQVTGMSLDASSNSEDFYSAGMVADAEL